MNTNSTIIVWSCIILSNIYIVSNTGIKGLIFAVLWLLLGVFTALLIKYHEKIK